MIERGYYEGISLREMDEIRNDIGGQDYVAEGMIPVGFSVIAGREKSGKSIVTLGSIAVAVALGALVFGRYPSKKGTVLYFALEESIVTLATRIGSFFSERNDSWFPPDNLKIYGPNSIPTWTNMAISAIAEIIAGYTDVVLVVIDTLQCVVPPRTGGNQADSYAFEYQIGSQLQQLALKFKTSIVAVHHTVKSNMYKNVFDSIGGTAFTKACETMMVLERDGNNAKLHIRGRTVPTGQIAINQNPDTLLWTALDSSHRQESNRSAARKVTEFSVDQIYGTDTSLRRKDILKRFKSESVSESSCDRWIERQTISGNLRKDEHGNYVRRDVELPSSLVEHSEEIATASLFDESTIAASTQPPPPLHTGNDGGGGVPTDTTAPPPSILPYVNDGGGTDSGDLNAIAMSLQMIFAGANSASPEDALARLINGGHPLSSAQAMIGRVVQLGYARQTPDGRWLIRLSGTQPVTHLNTVSPAPTYTTLSNGIVQ